MTTPASPAERQAPPQISDELVRVFYEASGAGPFPLVSQGIAAVYPLIEAEIKGSAGPTRRGGARQGFLQRPLTMGWR